VELLVLYATIPAHRSARQCFRDDSYYYRQQGMILASTNTETGAVAVLQAPEGSVPGDTLYVEGDEGPSPHITKKLASKV
jgi:hypothetical protein